MDKAGFKKHFVIIGFAGLVLLVVMNFAGVIGGFDKVMKICTPFWVGIAMAFILNIIATPIENFLAKKVFKKNKKLAKGLAITLSYVILLAVITALLAFVIPELVNSITSFVGNFDSYAKSINVFFLNLSEEYDFQTIDVEKLLTQFNDTIKNFANGVLAYLKNMVPMVFGFISNIVSFLFNFVMAVVISANILAFKEKLISQISRTFKVVVPKWYNKLADFAVLTADTFKKYISGQVLEACILGTLCYIGMLIFRFDYPFLISTVIAVTALIPVAGAYIGGAVAIILLGLVSPIKAVMFLVYLVLLQQFETNLIYPKVVGSTMELPGIWVILAVTIGGGAFGVLGILFAVPVMSIIYKLVREYVSSKEN